MNREPIREPIVSEVDIFLERTVPVSKADVHEPPPATNNNPCAADVLAAYILDAKYPAQIAKDVMARKAFGLKKYGTALQPCNGRNNLMDLYQELIDAAKYAMTEKMERQILNIEADNGTLDGTVRDLVQMLDNVYTMMKERGDFDGAEATTSH